MKQIITLILAASAAFSSFAQSSWEHLGIMSDGTAISFKEITKPTPNGMFKADIRVEYKRPTKSLDGRLVGAVELIVVMNCKNGKALIVQDKHFARGGEEIENERDTWARQDEPSVPDQSSPARVILDVVCGTGKKSYKTT